MSTNPKTECEICEICGNDKEWEDCWNCDEDGFVDHDCGEDNCCCLDPVPNVRCDICDGKGGYLVCPLASEHINSREEES